MRESKQASTQKECETMPRRVPGFGEWIFGVLPLGYEVLLWKLHLGVVDVQVCGVSNINSTLAKVARPPQRSQAQSTIPRFRLPG